MFLFPYLFLLFYFNFQTISNKRVTKGDDIFKACLSWLEAGVLPS